MAKSHKQMLGERFEIWLEKLLKEFGHNPVYRNVEYHKKKYVYRQVDLLYFSLSDGKIQTNIVEAKYSSGSEIKYLLRGPVKKNNDYSIITLNNLIDEVLERKKFLNANTAYLVTNTSFEPKLLYEAKKYKIKTISSKELCQMKFGVYSSSNFNLLQQSIKNIDVNDRKITKNVIYA